MKRALSIILSLALVLSLLPLNLTSVSAEQEVGAETTVVGTTEQQEAAKVPVRGIEPTYTEVSALPTASGYYKLAQDITGTKSYSSAEEITIDLNGHSITASNNSRIFRLSNGAKLTIIDSSADKSGRLHPAASGAPKGGVAAIFNEGDNKAATSLTLTDVTVDGKNRTAATTGGAFDIEAGTFTMNGGAIINCTAPNGGAIYVANGSLTLGDATVSGNTAKSGGGAYLANSAKLTINNAKSAISDNTATTTAGGVYLTGSAKLDMQNGKISGNKSSAAGGGIRADSSTNTLTITGGEISGNTAASIGGGLMTNAPATIKNATISGNTAKTTGGGIQAQGALSIENTKIQNNTATTGAGGAIYVVAAVTLKDCTLSGNKAGANGGAIALNKANYVVTLAGKTTVTDNTFGSAVSNFYLMAGAKFAVSVLTNGAEIGVTAADAANARVLAENIASDVAAYFRYDTADYGIGMNGTTLVLGRPVSSLALNKETLTLVAGADETLTVTVLPEDAANKGVAWSSCAEAVAAVDQNGKITAVADGTAMITATATDGSGKSATCTVTVATPSEGVVLSKETLTLTVGTSETLTATVLPESASNKGVTWSSSEESVATVEQTGKVTAVGNGTATITATAKDGSGKFATCTVTVTTPVSSVTLNKTTLALAVNATETLTATVAPETASNKALEWSSGKQSVATVDESGKVTAVGNGTATITATAKDGSGKSATCTVTVTTPVSGVTLNKTTLVLTVGTTSTLTASVLPATASNKGVTWSSSEESVATVDQTGKVTAVGVGTATITVTAQADPSLTKRCDVTVVEKHLHTGYACDCAEGGQWQPWTSTTTLPTASGYYYLYNDVTLSGNMTTLENADVVLCLNGKTVTAKSGGRVYKLNGGASLTICDCTAATVNGTYTAGKLVGSSSQGGCVWANKGNNFTLYDGILTGATNSAIFAWSNDANAVTTLTMKGGAITENSAPIGAAVYLNENNPYTLFKMEGGTIRKNTASKNGGAIGGKGTIEITGGTISENTATENGGAIYASGATVTLTNCELSGNKAQKQAGALWVTGGTVTLRNCIVSGNTSGKEIAAIYAQGGAKVTLDGTSVTGNTCGTAGYGAIAVPNSNSSITLKGKVTVKDNKTAAGVAQNLVIRDNVIVKVAELDATSEVHFTFSTWEIGRVFSDNAGENDLTACFVSDRWGYALEKQNGKLVLAYAAGLTPHTHDDVDWTPWLENDSLPTENGHWVLTRDVNLTKVQAYGAGKEIAICLNGFTVKQNGENVRLLRIADGAKVTICDCTGEGKLTGGNLPEDKNTGSGGAVYVAGEGSAFTLRSGSITGNTAGYHGGAIVAVNGAAVSVEGGRIAENSAKGNSGAIYVENATLDITGGELTANAALKAGGAIIAGKDAQVTVSGAKLSENTAGTTGGAISASSGAQVTINGAALEKNKAANGGAVYQEGASTRVTLGGGAVLSANEASKNGGAIYAANGTLTLVKATVEKNKATGSGGGAYLANAAQLTLSDANSLISENEAASGAGVCLASGETCTAKLVMQNGKITKNTSLSGGAGVRLDGKKTVAEITGGELSGNKAGTSGGAIFSNGTLTVKNAILSGNTAAKTGGAIQSQGVSLMLENVTLENNEATENGGAVWTNAALTMTGCTVKGNKALSGGAIYASGDVTLTIETTDLSSNRASAQGGALWVTGATVTLKNCTVSENVSAKEVAAIYGQGKAKLTIDSSTITENTCGVAGYGAVAVPNGNSTITLKGKVTIKDNVTAAGAAQNLVIRDDGGATVGTAGLSAESEIHFTLKNFAAGKVLSADAGETDVSASFVSDRWGYVVEKQENKLVLVFDASLKHTHDDVDWTPWLEKNSLPTEGGHYVLVFDVELKGAQVYNKPEDVHLCLNGHSVTQTGKNARLLRISDGAKVTVCDCTGEGKLTGGNLPEDKNTGSGGAVYVAGEGSAFTLLSGSITGNTAGYHGGAIVCLNGAELFVKGGKITGNTAKYNAGAVYVFGGKLHMTGGEIGENSAGKLAGGIYLAAAKAGDALGEMTGGSIRKNRSLDGDGAGMYLSAGSFTVGGTAAIEENDSAAAAGGVNVRGGATLKLTGGSVSKNTAKNGAGIVVTSNSHLEMSGGTVSGNKATGGNGGGIYIVKGSTLAMTGGTVAENTTTGFGGGVYLGGDGEFKGGSIEKNRSKNEGAGVYVGGENTMTLAGASVSNNVTEGAAGGINVRGKAKLVFTSGKVSNNTAKNGAGIVVTSNSHLEMSGGTVAGNKATSGNGGGIYIVKGSSFAMYGGSVSGNSSTNFAGGVYLGGDGTFGGGSITNNTSKNEGAGVYVGGENTMTLCGTAINGNTSKGAAGGVNVRGKATLVFTAGEVSNNTAAKSGGGIVITRESRLVMSGGTVSGNEAVSGSGGGIFVNEGCDIAMSGGKVSGNTAPANGAGIYLGGNGTFTGGSVEENTAGKEGGGVYVAGGNTMTIDGLSILNNKAPSAAGVLARGKAEVTFASGSVSGNTADSHGGGFLVQSYAVLNMTGGKISDNTAGNTGGGIRTTDNTISITGGEITGNMAGGQGGGIYTQAVDSVIRGVRFENNTANATSSSYKSYGGAVLLGTNASVTVENCTFTGNMAYGSGAAVGFWHTRYSEVKNCDFGGNTSHSFGGAIYVSASAKASVSGNDIHDNVATTRGGGILVDASGVLVADGNRFTGNTAANGGALYVQESGSASLTGETITGNSAKLASAIYSSGTLELLDVQITGNKATDNTAVYLDGMPNDDLTMNTTTKLGGDVVLRDNDGGDAYITNKGVIFVADEGLGAKAEIALRLESGLVSDMVFGTYDYEKLEECSYLITAGTRSMTDPEGAAPTPADPQPTEEDSSDLLLYVAIGGGAVLAAALVTILVVLRKKRSAQK